MKAMNSESEGRRRTIRNLAIFTFLVIALGWLGRRLDDALGTPPGQGIGITIWIIAPLGLSFLLRAFAGDGWKDLGIRPAIRGNVRWYAVSILIYPIGFALILVAGYTFRAVAFPDLSLNQVERFVQALAMGLAWQFFKNLFEEFAFRGYLAPKMNSLRCNALVAHAVVGLIWGVWHLPYLRVITPYTTESLLTLAPRLLAGTIAASVVYGEIRILNGSVWPAVLMHTIGGAFVGALMLQDFIAMTRGMEFLVAPVLEGGGVIVFFTLAGVGLFLGRSRRDRASERRRPQDPHVS